MLNFFTKLLTPVFIALGLVNPTPAIETPTQETQVQQELIELRQKVQELENKEIIEEINTDVKVEVPESKTVEIKKEQVTESPAPITDLVVGTNLEEKVVAIQSDINNQNKEEYLKSLEIFEKEFSSLNKKLSLSYSNAKKAEDLLIDKLKKIREEYAVSKSRFELNILPSDFERINCSGKPMFVCDNAKSKYFKELGEKLIEYYPAEDARIYEELTNLYNLNKALLEKEEASYKTSSKNLVEKYKIKDEDYIRILNK